MLSITSGSSRSCDGITRRDALRVGSLAALGMGLPGLLRAEEKAGRSGEVSCILLWLQGGLSHIDSFDPKPEAPAEIRGEFGVIDTNVPASGSASTSPSWRSSRTSSRSSARSTRGTGRTASADAYMLTGHPFSQTVTYPTYGSVIAKEKGDREQHAPVHAARHERRPAVRRRGRGVPGRPVQPVRPPRRRVPARLHGPRRDPSRRRRPGPLPAADEGPARPSTPGRRRSSRARRSSKRPTPSTRRRTA